MAAPLHAQTSGIRRLFGGLVTERQLSDKCVQHRTLRSRPQTGHSGKQTVARIGKMLPIKPTKLRVGGSTPFKSKNVGFRAEVSLTGVRIKSWTVLNAQAEALTIFDRAE